MDSKNLLEVKNLTKKYGQKVAVNDLSFKIEKGRIYGFLGPNGAGKSTTMNIITGCLAATSGEVKINGYDIVDDAVKAKRLIGYLPEMPPLYGDMTPFEYLCFVAAAKGLSKSDALESVGYVMERTALGAVCDRLIRNLSKGYRQRVGIAQAMLGNPELIILDEPTVGLDPKQIIEIRELIKSLAREHTVILSSHILSEVQEICDYIMIISGGNLVSSGTIDEIVGKTSDTVGIRLVAKAMRPETENVLKSIASVKSFDIIQREDSCEAEIFADKNDTDVREKLFCAFRDAGIVLSLLSPITHSLEEVYLSVTEAAPKPVTANRDDGDDDYQSVFGMSDEDDDENDTDRQEEDR